MFARRGFYCAFLLSLMMAAIYADVPDTITIHGQLLDDVGVPLTGTRSYRINFLRCGS